MEDIEARIRMLDALLEIVPPVSWRELARRESDDPQMEVLNQALASEWGAIQQYQHHLTQWSDLHGLAVKAVWEEHLADEQKHMAAINERINQLRGVPANSPREVATTARVPFDAGHDLIDAIRADLAGEQDAVQFYNQIIRASGLKDNVTRVVFESILMDEADHQNTLDNLLHQYDMSTAAQVPTEHEEIAAAR